MLMPKSFTASIIISATSSLLFLLLFLYAVVSKKIISAEDVLFLTVFLFIYSIFLLQSFLCWQIVKKNQQLYILSYRSVIVGNIICILSFLLAGVLILTTVAGVIYFKMYGTKLHLLNKTRFTTTIILITISCFTSIFNCIWYFKVIKLNKSIVNSVINAIGGDSTD